MQDHGTISFKISHEHADWMTNSQSYKFGPFGDGKTLDVTVFKNCDLSLEVRIAFEHHSDTFSGPIADFSGPELSVIFSWDPDGITLFIDGTQVFATPFLPSVH